MNIIKFKNNEYDTQIDYIKGLCILFVIWTHTLNRSELGNILFPYWGDTAVPIFLLIQVFHCYKKGIKTRMPDPYKLWKRILRPFIIMITLMFLTQFVIYYNVTDGVFSPALYWDKRGPGSYYIFIYLEFALVTPLFAPLFKRLSIKWLFVFFVILSQILEFTSCVTHCPDNIYRIIFIRYTFLFFLGYLLATKGLVINKLTIAGAITSMISLYIFNYTNIDLEPFFYTSLSNWKNCHWICYIYITYYFLLFLKYTYTKLARFSTITTSIEIIGRYSFEIYLFQIFYYATLSIYVRNMLNIIEYNTIQKLLYILISTAICVIPIVYLKSRKSLYNFK